MPRPLSSFVTLTEMRRRKGIPQAGSAADYLTPALSADTALRAAIARASRMVESYTGRTFVPYLATRPFNATGSHLTFDTLDLDEDLLEPVQFLNSDDTEIDGGDYDLASLNEDPKWRIILKPSAGITWTYVPDSVGAIHLAAVWGFHDNWSAAFDNTLDTVENNPLAASVSATSITVNDADGLDETGAMRFDVGDLLQIDGEYLLVTAVDPVLNTLTVQRAANGTTVAAHLQNAAIYSFHLVDDVMDATAAIASWLYDLRGISAGSIEIMDTTTAVNERSSVNGILKSIAHRQRLSIVGVGDN